MSSLNKVASLLAEPMPATPASETPNALWERAILHVDMDAFFVNVHLLDHPEDSGVPLVVGGRPEGRGVVASASYEARRYGIHSAMPSATALRLCSELKFASFNRPRIRECSQQVMSLLHEYGPVEKMSVDEAYVDLTGQERPETLAVSIRERVKAVTSLPASVGLATSKLVAKVASDHDKPEGCTIVRPGEEAAFLAPLPVRAIWGIGPRTAERLARLNITTCAQLADADIVELRLKFGRRAEALRQRAQGVDERAVKAEADVRKSISQERTFAHDVNDAMFLRQKLVEMAEEVGNILRSRGLVASTVVVKFRWADFTTFTRQKSVAVPFDDTAELVRLAQLIWKENWPEGQKMRLLGVGVTNLEEPLARQLELF